MKLYYAPGACSLADHITASEGGLLVSLERVDLKKHLTETGKDFRRINPKGYVPALVLDDGTLLTENSAILPFLGDKTGSMPEGMDRYRALEWIGYINSELHKSFSPLFGNATDDAKAKARQRIRMRLKFVEDRLTSNYLINGHFSPPDAYLFVILRWCANMGVDLSDMPRLKLFKARMEARPAVKGALAEEGLS